MQRHTSRKDANRETVPHSPRHLHQVPKPRYPHNSGILSERFSAEVPERQAFVAGVKGGGAPRDLLFQIFGKLKIEPTLNSLSQPSGHRPEPTYRSSYVGWRFVFPDLGKHERWLHLLRIGSRT